MSTQKKWIVSILTILLAICLAIDAWYVYIALFAPEKEVHYSFNVSDLVLADGTTKDIIQVQYYANKDGSGLEMFEINFNTLMDENRQSTYAQGLQFVAGDSDSGLDWGVYYSQGSKQYFTDKKTWNLVYTKVYSVFGSWGVSGNTYNYASSDDYNTTISNDTTPLSADSKLSVTISNSGSDVDIYYMQFKGDYIKAYQSGNSILSESEMKNANENFQTRKKTGNGWTNFWTGAKWYDYFYSYDPYWFAWDLYSKVSTGALAYGTDQYITFKYEDLFDYYKFDETTSSYVQVADEEFVKVKNWVSTNISIKVTVHEEGAQVASDSMFGVINDDSTFNLTGEKVYKDYFYGQNLVTADIFDFDLVNVSDNNYCLKLNSSFVKFYSQYKDKIELSVCVDLDVFGSMGYEFVGFTSDSGLSDFTIYECYTVKTVDGETVRTEVNYA
jgi:hypothetical protein